MSTETKQATINAMTTAREELDRGLAALSPEDLARPIEPGDSWTVAELLAHLAGLDEVATADVARIRTGAIPQLSAWSPEKSDRWNEFFTGTRANFPPGQLLDELRGQRLRLLAELTAAPPQQFEEGNFVRTMVDLMAGHERHHAEQLAARV
jgi:hypothetical protein